MMKFNFQLPDHSRIWIYQADRKLLAEEVDLIQSKGLDFTSHWAAHGNALVAELQVMDNYFVILALDEQMEMASGCSIDKSMRFILDLQNELKVSFTNRLLRAVLCDGEIELFNLAQAKEALKAGKIHPESLVFDNQAKTINELKNSWLKPLRNTWLRKILDVQKVD